jgi:hypothetical protein
MNYLGTVDVKAEPYVDGDNEDAVLLTIGGEEYLVPSVDILVELGNKILGVQDIWNRPTNPSTSSSTASSGTED